MNYIIEGLENRCLLAAQFFYDVNITTPSSNPGTFTPLNATTTIFWANGQLYATDGTSQNTIPIKSGLNQGTGVPMVVMGGFAYFEVFASSTVQNLWRTDGTSAGTQIVTQLPTNSAALAVCNDYLYFGVTVSSHGQLWKSDGTAEGTQLVHQFSGSDAPSGMTYFNGFVYFQANDVGGRELWRSDGTDPNTTLVKDINSSGDSSPSAFHVSNGMLFFAASIPAGIFPYRTDGTSAGTVVLGAVTPGSGVFSAQGFVDIGNGTTVFTSGGFIYKTTGTGFTKVYGGTGDAGSSFTGLVAMGSLAFCIGSTSATGQHLWRTDGTHAGTFAAEALSTTSTSPSQLTPLNGNLYFVANSEIGETDGVSVSDAKIVIGKRPFFFTALSDGLIFSADDPVYGREPFISDGTSVGTKLLADVNATPNSSSPAYPLSIGDNYFSVVTPNTTTKWAMTDGTTVSFPAGSAIPSSFNGYATFSTIWNGSAYYFGASSQNFYRLNSNGSGSSILTGVHWTTNGDPLFTSFNGKLYFAAAAVNNPSIYYTDGTAANSGILDPNVSFFGGVALTAGDTAIYFAGTLPGANSISTLYRSDGVSGSTALTNQRPSATGSYEMLTWFHGKLYFFWSDLLNNNPVVQMYCTDGVSAPTLIKQFPGSFGVPRPVIFNDHIYFSASSLSNSLATKLWISDGTPAGTTETQLGFSSFITVLGSRLFFTVPDGVFTRTLWVTDGTDSGTFRLCNADASSLESIDDGHWSGHSFAIADGNIFFNANDGVHGAQLWRSDGTLAGTQMLTGLTSGSLGGNPSALGNAGSAVIYASTDSAHGRELWKQADEFPPAVWSESVSIQKNLTATIGFNEPIDSVGLLSGLSVVNVDTHVLVDISGWTATFDANANSIQLSTAATAALSEGNFELRIDASDVRDLIGNADLNDLVIPFFNLPADANQDRHVDTLDFTVLAQNFNHTSATPTQGDFNFDGVVNALDFNLLASNFGIYLPPPTSPESKPFVSSLSSNPGMPSLFAERRIGEDDSSRLLAVLT